ncbi:SMC-Scp complex subunit ScpB [Candidatus Woesearchaeota archaeon]|nr:SMC-Scp complex subunit ScpB [Candidatus Woesearchaeota archaeon]
MTTEVLNEIKGKIEAILFAAGRAVPLGECEVLAQVKTPGLVKEAVTELKQEYDGRNSPLMIVDEAEGWKLTVREKFLSVVQRINPETELNKATMETLAIVAWRSPVLQSEVIHIRTNKAYDHIAELEEAGFISKERHGRTYMIKTTKKFYDYFDLPDQQAVKELFKEFKDLEPQKKMEDFSAEEAKSGALNLEVYDAAAQPAKPIISTQEKAHKGEGLGGLDVFEVPEEEIAKEESELVQPPRGQESGAEVQAKAKKVQETPQESEAEKARRLARELLDEKHELFSKLPKEEQKKKESRSKQDKEEWETQEVTAEEFEEYPGQKTDASEESEDEDA